MKILASYSTSARDLQHLVVAFSTVSDACRHFQCVLEISCADHVQAACSMDFMRLHVMTCACPDAPESIAVDYSRT
jgi:hypothetical protein